MDKNKVVKNTVIKSLAVCISMLIMLFVLAIIAMKLGSIELTYEEILRGLFVEYDKRVATIYNLRFPRIVVAILGGMSLSVSGLLFQAVLKNPLADPGIIGISGGAGFASAVVISFIPELYFFKPIFAFIGGIIAFVIIYTLAWKDSLDTVRIILVGIAISAVFSGLTNIFQMMGNQTGVNVVVSGLTQLVWDDVKIIGICTLVGIVSALILAPACNVLGLEDKTIRSLGVNVDVIRIIISIVAVVLVSGVTSVVGVIGFLALIVPHMARKIIGSNHIALVPFTAILGGFVLLLADTLGRIIATPNEIPAGIIMSVIGGPFFIMLIRNKNKVRNKERNKIKKNMYALLGFISFGLGCIGSVLPILPTVPFLLLSAFCFARASERINNWFKQTNMYKNNLESFCKGEGMTKKVKMKILTMVTILLLVAGFMMRNVRGGVLIILIVWIAHLISFLFFVKTKSEEKL